jgi:hypothetical protein
VTLDALIRALAPREVTGARPVEIADLAPVALREPIRGLLWVTGWLRVLAGPTARSRALGVAADLPDDRLLGLGHGMSMACVHPASFVLADSEGTHSLRPDSFASATPDVFSTQEADWLRHLEHRHIDVVAALTRHLPAHRRTGRPRPLGLDRFGLRLRIESDGGDHDVRLAFSRQAGTATDIATELRRLAGCPFLAATADDRM